MMLVSRQNSHHITIANPAFEGKPEEDRHSLNLVATPSHEQRCRQGILPLHGGDANMGERTRFEAGDRAPNDGEYIEIGEHAFHMGIENPRHVYLEKGDRFPVNSKQDRKWTLMRRGKL